MTFIKELEREQRYRSVISAARTGSYYNPTNSRRIDYEANNAFARMIISIITFSDKRDDRMLSIVMDNPIDRHLVKKWKEELEDKGIQSRMKNMIAIINGCTKLPEIKLKIPNIHKEINPDTLKRMKTKYYQHTTQPTNKGFIEAVTIVYLRYNTYNAWSSSWSIPICNNIDYSSSNLFIELFGAPFNTEERTSMFGTLFPDVDRPFGGYMRYHELYHFILNMNHQNMFFNIWINPPFITIIMDDITDIIRDFQRQNIVAVLYPTWPDQASYIQLMNILKHHEINDRVLDMWTNRIINNVKTTLFY